MKSAGNRGIVHGRLQVLHVHVLLAAPLGTCHMAEPGADQHQGGVAIGECPHHPRPSADLTVQPLDHVVGADARPVLAGKFAFSRDAFLLSCAWIALSIFATILTLDLGTTEKTLR